MSYDLKKAAGICRDVIEQKGLTLLEVAKLSGLSVITIKRFLDGKTSNPSAPTLGKLFHALGLEARDVL